MGGGNGGGVDCVSCDIDIGDGQEPVLDNNLKPLRFFLDGLDLQY